MDRKVFELTKDERPIGKYEIYSTYKRHLTQRAVLWVGMHCDLKCLFCYDKYLDPLKKTWIPLDSAIAATNKFRFVYNNKWIDLTGGEPTLYPHILDLIHHCAEIKLEPTCITHGLHLANKRKVQSYKNAGIHSFLISIHGIGNVLDTIHGLHSKNATQVQLKALENLRSADIPFRINITIIKNNKKQLIDLVKLGAKYGAWIINFIIFNPYFEWREQNLIPFQVSFSEIAPYLKEAIDCCTENSIESNVRYMPICQLKGYEEHIYTGFQLPYDVLGLG